ncbi:hypothetical protein Patl1_35051 [Pistacia atlantica]|uniref:Uncharacterized protein n=1 Tax=Pistacia atlantica TaxID=434234 RepID=A0ACC0ZV17_9ROSI|nr:hypothetical protein Patl1_35051 [Pistacia atlantica]
MYIREKGKIRYFTSEIKALEKTDPSYATWDAENSMIMSWPVNSMDEDISSNYMCYPIAKKNSGIVLLRFIPILGTNLKFLSYSKKLEKSNKEKAACPITLMPSRAFGKIWICSTIMSGRI